MTIHFHGRAAARGSHSLGASMPGPRATGGGMVSFGCCGAGAGGAGAGAGDLVASDGPLKFCGGSGSTTIRCLGAWQPTRLPRRSSAAAEKVVNENDDDLAAAILGSVQMGKRRIIGRDSDRAAGQ